MMKFFSIGIAFGIVVLALIGLPLTRAEEQAATSRIVTAANGFLATLDQKQRHSVLFSFDDAEQRKRWSNFPVVVVRRGGMSLKEMNATQRSAVMTLLAATLSPMGLEKVEQIMEGDEVNKVTDKGPGAGGGQRPPGDGGGPPGFGNGRSTP